MTTSAIVDRPAARTQPPAVHPAPAWTVDAVLALFELPFADLLFRAQEALRAHFDPNAVQRSTLLSIKTGNCSEDCGYCSQSKRHQTGLEAQRLLSTDEVLAAAKAAKAQGAGRFCMGAAWRGPKEKDMAAVAEMVREVKALGLETCVTLGILKDGQAEALKVAGLDYYNHNLDTAPEFYGDIVTTHTYQAVSYTHLAIEKMGGWLADQSFRLTRRRSFTYRVFKVYPSCFPLSITCGLGPPGFFGYG